jgi:hypothetical protein
MTLSREQVVAFRLGRHHLGARTTPLEAAYVGLQDTPPGAAGTAFAARADGGPEAFESQLVIVPSLRGAPMAVDPAEQAIFTAAIAPRDEDDAKVVVGNAWKPLERHGAMEALDIASEAVREVLADGPLVKTDFHRALTERVPEDLRWWCKGCGEHHVHPSLWRATGIRGVLAIVGRDGRSPVYGPPPSSPAIDDPAAELARRFLRVYGPARPKLLADFAGISTAHATELWERAGELAEVVVEGKKAWLLAEDVGAASDPPAIDGVRLLPSLDPLAGGRDRELLVPDPAARKRIWAMIGGAGMVLAGGAVAGTWRPAKKGRKLLVTVTPLSPGALRGRDGELAAEAERLAPFRGAEVGEVTLA